MEFLKDIIALTETIVRPFLLVVASIFSVIFSWRKIGQKIEVTYRIGFEAFSHPRILSLTLNNCKDKPVPLYSIYAVFEGEHWLELDKFEPPKILKPLETISIKTPEFSKLYIGNDQIKPNLRGHIDFYIETSKKLIKCINSKKASLDNGLIQIEKEIARFGDIVFDENIKFILQYNHNKTGKIALFHSSGHISGEWNFGNLNNIGCSPTIETIRKFLDDKGFNESFVHYVCFEVKYPITTVAFSKDSSA